MIDEMHFAALCAELNGLTSTQQQIALNKYVRSNSGVICQIINDKMGKYLVFKNVETFDFVLRDFTF